MRELITRRAALTGALSLSAAPARAQQAPRDIVARADLVRNPRESFRVTSTLTEYISGQARDRTVLTVFSKADKATGQFRNLVRYVEPPRDRGKMALLDGQSLWFYDPAAKSSVRISTQQRLIGQAAIGDVLTVNFAIDYTAQSLGDDTISDTERKQRRCWHLDMRAASSTAVYARAEYWVEQDTYWPVKVKFYSDSGRVLKILYYREFSERLGAVRPGGAVIIDAVDATLVTTVRFDNQAFQDIPDIWFQRDYLPRLNAE